VFYSRVMLSFRQECSRCDTLYCLENVKSVPPRNVHQRYTINCLVSVSYFVSICREGRLWMYQNVFITWMIICLFCVI